jgi:hypothetical protein
MTRAEENRRHSATAGPSAITQFIGRNQDNALAPPAPAGTACPTRLRDCNFAAYR